MRDAPLHAGALLIHAYGAACVAAPDDGAAHSIKQTW